MHGRKCKAAKWPSLEMPAHGSAFAGIRELGFLESSPQSPVIVNVAHSTYVKSCFPPRSLKFDMYLSMRVLSPTYTENSFIKSQVCVYSELPRRDRKSLDLRAWLPLCSNPPAFFLLQILLRIL